MRCPRNEITGPGRRPFRVRTHSLLEDSVDIGTYERAMNLATKYGSSSSVSLVVAVALEKGLTGRSPSISGRGNGSKVCSS